jgi:signal transduction histidine kinase
MRMPVLSMRGRLIAVVLAIVLPFAAASGLIAWRQYQDQSKALGQTLLSVSRSLSAAADRELAAGLALVEGLANSPSLDDGRLAEFHRLAQKVAATRRDAWMLLIDPSGQVVMHTRHPFGTPLPNSFALERELSDAVADEPPLSGASWVRKVFETRGPVYTDLFRGPISGSFVVAVGVPVIREGRLLYCLTLVMPANAFQPLVEDRPRLEGSGALLFDNRGFVIAHAVTPERFVGRRAPADSIAAVRASGESVDRGVDQQGQRFLRAVTRSQVSGWTAGVSLSERAAFGAIWRSLAESLVLATLILLASTALAIAIGRSMARRRLAEEESRAKDEFLAALSHELRNPLAAILSSTELLQRVPEGPLAALAAERIARQAAQMRRLLDDILDTTRAIHGKLGVQPQSLDLRDRAAQGARDHASRPGVSARMEVTGEAVWVRADPTRLQQMIDNLIENAIKYGAKNVALHAARDDGFGVLTITDDGQGIAPGLMQRLFQPFVQGEQSLERPQGGLGLGLALVRRLAELHGGSIAAHSAGSGTGSRFTLRLPLAPPAPAPRRHPRSGAYWWWRTCPTHSRACACFWRSTVTRWRSPPMPSRPCASWKLCARRLPSLISASRA